MDILTFIDKFNQNFDKQPEPVYNTKKYFMGGSVTTPKRGLVDEPGSYAGDEVIGKPYLDQTKFIEEFTTKRINGDMNGPKFVEYLNKNYSPSEKTDAFNIINVDRRLRIAQEKNLISKDIVTKGSTADRALTPEKYISVIGEEKYAELKDNPTKLKNRYEFANLSKKQRAEKVEKTRQKNKNLSEKQILDRKEKALVNRQSVKGYSFYKVNKAESLLWNDLLRTANNKNGYFTFKGETPVKGEYYNRAATEGFVLVDKKGNEFKYSTLLDDVKKHSGEKLDDVLRPYKQKEFLATEGLTKELNKLAGYEPGSPKSVFHTQHIEGIDKNPWKVHLTFGNQNIKESASRKSFNADWKAATYVDENGKTKVRLNDVGKIGDANYKPGGKTAVNRYYKSLGPDIVAQIGKKPKGEIKTLIQLLDKTGIKLTDLQKTKGFTLGSNLANLDKDLLDFRKLPGDVRNFANIAVDAAKSPASLNAARKLKSGLKFTGYGALTEIPFAAPFALSDYAAGKTGDRILGEQTFGLAGQTEQEEIREATGERGYATQLINDYSSKLKKLSSQHKSLTNSVEDATKRESIENLYRYTKNKYDKEINRFVDDKGQFNNELYNQALNNYTAGMNQISKFDTMRAEERPDERTGLESYDVSLASGGLANLTRTIPPEKGPQSQGLAYFMKNGKR